MAKVRQQIRNNKTMCDVFQQTLQKHRDKVAFVFEDKHWTFQEVEYFSNKVANYFQSVGYKKGDVVALFMENRPELVFFWLGLAKIGVISSLINFNLRKESLAHCITIVCAKGLVFSSDSTISGKIKSKLHYQPINQLTNENQGINSNVGQLIDHYLNHILNNPTCSLLNNH